MTQYDLCEDNSGKNHQHAKASDRPPEAGNKYVGAQVLLPHGDQVVSGQVRWSKRDKFGNPQGVSNVNTILDTNDFKIVFLMEQ